MEAPVTMFATRVERARSIMHAQGVDVLLLSVGADMPYLIGYEAMPLERLTMLVLGRTGAPVLVVPKLEAPRVVARPDVFEVVTWAETDDPVAIVAKLIGNAPVAAIGDTTWARFLVDLLAQTPNTTYRRASSVIGPLRAVKDQVEIEALRRVGAAVDRIAGELQSGGIALIGRTEASVSAELGSRMLAEGHHRVNFAIVAAGENAASPHHEAGSRVIRPGEVVLCDFGGSMLGTDGVGYCSDITRCVHLGEPTNEFAELYAVLYQAQAASVRAATVGTPCEDIDAAGRRVIEEAGYGEYFIHRTGHGIGVEAHEDPYIVSGNTTPLASGHAFSIEPGIYVPGRFGARLEDIVVATNDGPDAMNRVDHHLAIIES